MTDRELLEMAAKAAGWAFPPNPKSGAIAAKQWNPLIDDGDALRLAVKLSLLAKHDVQIAPVNVWEGDDPYAATRRAIVRAAAEIGRGME